MTGVDIHGMTVFIATRRNFGNEEHNMIGQAGTEVVCSNEFNGDINDLEFEKYKVTILETKENVLYQSVLLLV